jgi:SAM-dependent methyltransferase
MRTEAFAERHVPSLADRFGVWLSARQIRRWSPSFTGKRVGDFGCGFHAAFARTILSEATEVVLVDVSLADDLKRDPKVKAITGSLPEALTTLPTGSLDVVLLMSILEHLWEPGATLHEIRRLLSASGLCLVNVPSWRGKRYLEFSAFRLGTSPAAEMDDHKMYYDVRDLWPLLVRAGFLPRDIRCFPHKFGLNTFAVCRVSDAR